MTTTTTNVGTQVYRVYIRATPQAIWDAITSPEWTARYGYGGRAEWDPELKPGATYRGARERRDAVDGRAGGGGRRRGHRGDPPHKLVQTWRMLMDDSMVAEGFTRLTYEIAEGKGGVSKLTVTHELEGKPQLALLLSGGLEDMGAGGGWSWVLSDLKTLLETGASMDPHDELNQG